MRRMFFVVSLLGGFVGCAGEQHPGGGMCALADFAWPQAARDFDRSSTLELEATLEKLASEDAVRARTGDVAQVGASLDELYKRSPPSGFIGHGVASIAIRLRQLDCGVRAGRIAPAQSQALYDSIAADLRGEHAALSPPAASGEAKAAP